MVSRGIKVAASIDDVKGYEQSAKETAIDQLVDIRSSLNPGDTDTIHVRSAIPDEDLDVNTETIDDAVVTADDPTFYVTPDADEEGDWFGYYAFDSDEKFEDKSAVVWGFQYTGADSDADMPIAALRVRNRTNGLIDHVDLTSLDVSEHNTLLYDDPLVLADKKAFLELYLEDGAAEQEIPFKPLVTIAEDSGDTLEASDRFASAQ